MMEEKTIDKELKGLMKGDCPFCKKEEIVIRMDKETTQVWKTCYVDGRQLEGLEVFLPKCPKCNEFIGAAQTKFKGFYTYHSDEMSKRDMHKHICPKCGWESKEYKGTFIARD